MSKKTIFVLLIQLYSLNTFAEELDESGLYIKIPCPGKICWGQCCVIPGYICCEDNLFCARDVQYCSHGHYSSIDITTTQLFAMNIFINYYTRLTFF